ncbi:unnamed protein product [Cuscuta campestris]|uniref:Mre11 DNA-binding domain-containing protein n=1 Tax=Cuscuta campestris TaxID=132261 RepID=A0A484LUV9_9ASTE|nr:unnamed protein product [Cuscuta campestris]
MFQTPHAVQWMRPDAKEGYEVSDWFNILVLHQNRVKTNPKNAINEHFLPRFLDFIVWGHEHECLIDPQEVPGMGFHISQPGSSVATSLIDGESKAKHVLLLEIKGNQYRPTKIPLKSVRPFEYTEIALKDEPDIDPNDQNSILEHLDKVVRKLIEQSNSIDVNGSENKLPLVRVKVDYSGFMTINPQRFGQKYVGKVANPQDVLIFSKSTKKGHREGAVKIEDAERLRPEELNQQNIEALVAESNLKMEILPVNDLDVALHSFVNKDDKMAFHSCVQHNLKETRNKIAKDSDPLKCEEDDLILKVGELLEERVKERATLKKDDQAFIFSGQSSEIRNRSAVSFSDDENTSPFPTSKYTAANKGRKEPSPSFRSSHDASELAKTSSRGRGRGRGRGRASTSLKQTTLDASLGIRQSQRSASVRSIEDDAENVDSSSSGEANNTINDVNDSSDEGQTLQGKGRKRAAPGRKGKGRGVTSTAKRGKKSENASSSLQKLLMKVHGDDDDDDDDDEEELQKKVNKYQPRVTRNYGAIRR